MESQGLMEDSQRCLVAPKNTFRCPRCGFYAAMHMFEVDGAVFYELFCPRGCMTSGFVDKESEAIAKWKAKCSAMLNK